MLLQLIGGNGLATYTVEAVATRDEIAFQFPPLAADLVAYSPCVAGQLVQLDLLSFVLDLPARRKMGIGKILLYLRLSIDGDVPSGQSFDVDAVGAIREGEFETAMSQALLV